MTGVELKAAFEKEVDQPYTGYTDDASLNQWFKKALINVINQIYRERLNNQNAYDEINYLIATDVTYNLNNNQIYTSPLAITNVTVAGALATVTTELPHNLTVGDTMTTSGITGFTPNPNYTNTVFSVVSTFSFRYTIPPTAGTYTAGTGIVTPANSISDYFHYLFGKAKFTSLTNYVVLTATNTTPIKISLNKRTSFRSGEQATIAGFLGNTAANGTFYLNQLNEFQYTLYSDAKLRTPVAGNGTPSGTGTINVITENRLLFMPSDLKGTLLQNPTINAPFFQQSKLLCKILPSTETCQSITVDYIRQPPRFIDVTDNVIDYSNYYPLQMQYNIITETGKLLGLSSRDGSLVQGENEQLINNP